MADQNLAATAAPIEKGEVNVTPPSDVGKALDGLCKKFDRMVEKIASLERKYDHITEVVNENEEEVRPHSDDVRHSGEHSRSVRINRRSESPGLNEFVIGIDEDTDSEFLVESNEPERLDIFDDMEAEIVEKKKKDRLWLRSWERW